MDNPGDIPETCSVCSAVSTAQNVRGRRVILLLLLLWIVGIFDLIFTLIADGMGTFIEANPIAARIIHDSEALTAFKFGSLALATVILFKFRQHRFTELCCWIICGFYTMLSLLWMFYYYTAD